MPERPVSHQQKERGREKEQTRERERAFPALAQILAAPATKAK